MAESAAKHMAGKVKGNAEPDCSKERVQCGDCGKIFAKKIVYVLTSLLFTPQASKTAQTVSTIRAALSMAERSGHSTAQPQVAIESSPAEQVKDSMNGEPAQFLPPYQAQRLNLRAMT